MFIWTFSWIYVTLYNFCAQIKIVVVVLWNLCNINVTIGNKMNNIAVVYTLWGNLKKTSDMEVGQVGFHSNKEVQWILFFLSTVNSFIWVPLRNFKINFLSYTFLLFFQVRIIKVEKRINEIVNRLNKTKEESFPNLRGEREERDRLEREDGKQKLREQVFCPHLPTLRQSILISLCALGWFLIRCKLWTIYECVTHKASFRCSLCDIISYLQYNHKLWCKECRERTGTGSDESTHLSPERDRHSNAEISVISRLSLFENLVVACSMGFSLTRFSSSSWKQKYCSPQQNILKK